MKLLASTLKQLTLTSRELENIYNISRNTLANYRRGYYFTNKGDKKYFLPSKEKIQFNYNRFGGTDITYTVPDVNAWFRKIGQQDKIPQDWNHV